MTRALDAESAEATRPATSPPGATATTGPSPAQPGSPGPAPAGTRRLGSRAKVLLVASALLVLYGLWVLSLQFVAYTGDAFVATDVVLVAPEVGGRISAVHVVDNQSVDRGQTLIEIDPTPFRLRVEKLAAELRKAEADEQSAVRAVGRAAADRRSAEAALALARRTEHRYADLASRGAASQLVLDEAVTRRSEAEAALNAAEAVLEAARQAVVAYTAQIGVAREALQLARWELEQTVVPAPIDGHVNNLWLRTGDYALAGVPRLGLVATDGWSAIALYKEQSIRHIRPGQPVWIHLDLYPWRLLRGRVQGITRGISREDRQTSPLPAIEPVTGWIRFQRRLPVRIRIDPIPDDVRLHSGANARTLVVFE